MCSPGINEKGKLRGQPANPGSPGKMAAKMECINENTAYGTVKGHEKPCTALTILQGFVQNILGGYPGLSIRRPFVTCFP